MSMLDKRMTPAEIVGELKDGMTLGIGGWGPRRKPMALVREILRSDLKDLTVVAYGGADVGMLCAAGKVKKLVFAFVSLDAIPLEPWFRKARESGATAVDDQRFIRVQADRLDAVINLLGELVIAGAGASLLARQGRLAEGRALLAAV
mgnify:CR=1 FL=1